MENLNVESTKLLKSYVSKTYFIWMHFFMIYLTFVEAQDSCKSYFLFIKFDVIVEQPINKKVKAKKFISVNNLEPQ